jgi:cobalt-zinc-cadmium efflux system outer membrane protein
VRLRIRTSCKPSRCVGLAARVLAVSLTLAAFDMPAALAEQKKGPPPKSSMLQLDDVIKATLEHHPALHGEIEERRAADADLLSAQGAFDPSIKGEGLNYAAGGYSGSYGGAYVEQPLQLYGSKVVAGYRVGDGTFPIYDNWYETNNGGEAQAGIEVPLLRDGPTDRRRVNISKSEAGQRVADAMVEQRKIELARAAALSYWDWTAAKLKVKTYAKLLEVAMERDRQITERVAKGDLPDFDRVDNQRAVLQRQAQLLTAERSLRNSEFTLGLFYRDAERQPRDVSALSGLDKIPLPLFEAQRSPDEPMKQAIESRPEFRGIQAQREQNEFELKLARNQILPRLDLKVFTAKDYGQGVEKREETELKAGVRFEIPLMTRTQEGRIDFYEAKQRKLAFTETFLKERIRADVQDALNALEIARKRVNVTAQEVQASRSLAEGERVRFGLGDSNLIFVNLREQNAADAEVREIEALQDYQKAFVAFEATLARIHTR